MRFVHEVVTPRVVFHVGSLDRAADEAALLGGARVLLIADPHNDAASELLQAALGKRMAGIVAEVVEHVPVEVAQAAVEHADSCGADLLLSLGGGSATGLAKAIARERGTPILAVPTTYAGSEMTPIWGLTEGPRKTTGRDERVRPRTVLYDPELTVSMPSSLTAASGMNALAHCVEAAYAHDASPVIRLSAIEGVRALAAGLPRCVDDPTDRDARSLALYGAWLAGMTLGNASMGIHHKACHVLGGAYRLPHGALHAAMLPYTAAFNRDAAPEVMARLAEALGADDAPGGLWDLAGRLGAPRSVAEIGFAAADVDAVARTIAAGAPANPREVDEDGVRALLEAAVEGARPERNVAERVTTGGEVS